MSSDSNEAEFGEVEMPFALDDEKIDDRSGTLEVDLDGEEIVLTWAPRWGGSLRSEMLRFDRSKKLLRIFPRSIRSGELENQFSQVKELWLDAPEWDPYYHSVESERYGLLRALGLPDGFNVLYTYGLGISRHYQDFVQLLEERSTCSVIHFTRSGDEGISPDGKTFRVTLERFERYRAAVERNRGRARTAVSRVNDAECHNAVADLLELDLIAVKYGRNEIIQKLTEEIDTGYVMSAEDRQTLVQNLSTAAIQVARETPARFGQLRLDIELVTLQTLVDQFERDLDGGHANDEPHWQDFFNTNRFALQQLFSMPIVVVQPQAHVQDADITGRGARIADFLCANTVTGSVVIVEIKTPGGKIMDGRPYRGTGSAAVYPLHKTLSGAVAQLQSQMVAVPQSLSHRILRQPLDMHVDAWHDIRGAIIVGKLSSLTDEQRESFMRYRSAFSNLTILGYDEVLERLKGLLSVLKDRDDDA